MTTRVPSKAYRRQVAALRLLGTVAEQISESYARAGETAPPEISATVAALDAAIRAQWEMIGYEDEVLTTKASRRRMAREAREMAGLLRTAWPGQVLSAAELVNASMLIVEDIRISAPDDGRRQGWSTLAWLLSHVTGQKDWDQFAHVEAGARSGEILQGVWG